MIVASAVLLALISGLYLLTNSGMRYFQLNRVRSEDLLQLTRAMNRLEEDLAGTAKVSVTPGTSPVAYVWMLSAEGFQGQPFHFGDAGQLYWRKRICYFLDQTRLMRTQIPLEAETMLAYPPAPPAPDLDDFRNETDHREQVAADISAFNVTVDPDLNEVKIQLAARQQTASDRSTQLQLETIVKVENQ